MPQPPRDFRKNPIPANQPAREFRPNFTALDDPAIPVQVRQFSKDVTEAFRQTIDNVQGVRSAFGPTSVYMKGDLVPIEVPVSASDADPGSGILTFQLTRPGTWIVTAAVCLNIVGDNGQIFWLGLVVGQNRQPQVAKAMAGADQTMTMHQSWQLPASGGGLCRLVIKKDGGSGTSNVEPNNSSLTGYWQGT